MDELLACSDARLLAICKANDRDGEWDGASRDFLLETILRWSASEFDFWGTLRFLLGLA